MEQNWRIKSGISCLIFGYHNILLHPLTLFASYIDRHKKIPSFEWVILFFLHDIGYAFISMEDILSVEKDNHPEYGARIIKKILDEHWADISIRHSRDYCKGKDLSELGYLDKDCYRFHPITLAMIQCFISGELGTRNLEKINMLIVGWRNKAKKLVDSHYELQ